MSDIGDNTQNRGDIPTPHVAEHIAGKDDLYGSDSKEVILKKHEHSTGHDHSQ